MIVSTSVTGSAPTAPSNLSAEVNDEGYIKISWSMPSNVANLEGYQIYRNDVLIDKTTGLSYIDEKADPGKYTYYVRAIDDSGNLSNIRNSITIDNKAPNEPEMTAEAITDSSVKLSWSISDNDIDYFKIYRNKKILTTVKSLEFVDTGLSVAEIYEYYVVAYDEYGNCSEKSNTTVFCSEDTELPQIISITPDSGQQGNTVNITVSIKDNISVAGAILYYSYDNKVWNEYETKNCKLGSRTATVNFVIKASQFDYEKVYIRAVAYDSFDNISNADGAPTVIYNLDNTAPEIPQEAAIIITEGYGELMWSVPESIDLNYFRIYCSINNGNYELIKDGYTYSNYFITDYEIGVYYNYCITAVDVYGNESEPSDTVSFYVETDGTPPRIQSVAPRNGRNIAENQTVSVAVSDNYNLKSISVLLSEYGKDNFRTIYYDEISGDYCVPAFTIPTDDLEDGIYQLKFIAMDSYGNESSEYHIAYNYEKCKLSEPVLTAEGQGWKNTLKWSLENDTYIAGYRIMKKNANSSSYSVLADISY